jgi:hypothetical protein
MEPYDRQLALFKSGRIKKMPQIPKSRCALIFDDALTYANLFRSSIMCSISSTFRHKNIYLFINTQNLMRIEKTTRINADYAVMFRPGTEGEYEDVSEYCASFKDKKYIDMLIACNEKSHEFILSARKENKHESMICPTYQEPRRMIKFGSY